MRKHLARWAPRIALCGLALTLIAATTAADLGRLHDRLDQATHDRDAAVVVLEERAAKLDEARRENDALHARHAELAQEITSTEGFLG